MKAASSRLTPARANLIFALGLALATLVQERVAHADLVVRTRREGGLDAAQQLVAAGDGKRIVDAARRVLTRRDDEERRLLARRNAASQRAERRVPVVTTVARGEAVGLFGTSFRSCRSENRRSEAALRGSGAKFRALIMNSHEGIALFGADGAELYTSPAPAALLGYQPGDLRPRSLMEFVRTVGLAAVAERMGEGLRRPGAAMHNDAYGRHLDGQWRCREGVFTNRLHEPGINASVSNCRDRTERQAAGQKIREQPDELRRCQAVRLHREERVKEPKREFNELLVRRGEPPHYPGQVTT